MSVKQFLMMAVALVMVSCGGNNSAKNLDQIEAVAVEVDALVGGVDELIDKTVEVEGLCTHICSHGATKIFLMGSSPQKTIRIEAAELGTFSQKCVNSIVRVKGLLREERIDEPYLQRWEQRVAAQTDEQHGDDESGCSTEKASRGETGNTVAERIADFRAKIAARQAADGKPYLSFYYVEALGYEVLE